MSFKRFSSPSALNTLLLTLLLWSAVWPAYLKQSPVGHWTELCTTAGFKNVWVNDQADALVYSSANQTVASAAGEIEAVGATDAPIHSGHAKPHCPWCIFSLPALAILVLCAFFTPRFSHILPAVDAPPLRISTALWHWACPRAPPQSHLLAV